MEEKRSCWIIQEYWVSYLPKFSDMTMKFQSAILDLNESSSVLNDPTTIYLSCLYCEALSLLVSLEEAFMWRASCFPKDTKPILHVVLKRAFKLGYFRFEDTIAVHFEALINITEIVGKVISLQSLAFVKLSLKYPSQAFLFKSDLFSSAVRHVIEPSAYVLVHHWPIQVFNAGNLISLDLAVLPDAFISVPILISKDPLAMSIAISPQAFVLWTIRPNLSTFAVSLSGPITRIVCPRLVGKATSDWLEPRIKLSLISLGAIEVFLRETLFSHGQRRR